MKRRATGAPGRAERSELWGAMSGPATFNQRFDIKG
jgi:hypothetical protein